MAVEAISQCMEDLHQPMQQQLVQSIDKANRAILKAGLANEDLFEMGTTVTAVLVRDGHFTVANVGDSGCSSSAVDLFEK